MLQFRMERGARKFYLLKCDIVVMNILATPIHCFYLFTKVCLFYSSVNLR